MHGHSLHALLDCTGFWGTNHQLTRLSLSDTHPFFLSCVDRQLVTCCPLQAPPLFHYCPHS